MTKPNPLLLAQQRLTAYAIAQQYDYQVAHHHRLIASKLEAVERGECKRLMIFMPPRHGKSRLASEFFPAWYLGRNPTKQIIACTYSQDFADDFGRKVRNQLRDPLHQGIFPGCGVREDSKSASRFHTRAGGVYVAVGAGGPITGRGAHILLIDDPIKNQAEADSETHRRHLKDWYASTAYTRLMPGGAVIVIQTRWHEDDLAGWLLSEHAHEGWEVLSLPAINQEGAALWPEAYPIERLRVIEKTLGPRKWEALFQQRPRPAEGSLFKRPWFEKIVNAAPAKAQRVRYWDKAGTDGGGARTAGVLLSKADGLYYVEDVIKGQWSAAEREKVIKQTAELDRAKHGPEVTVWLEQEPGSGGKESAENTIRNLDGFTVRAERVTGDKVTRAEPFSSQAEVGNVRLVRGAWNAEYIEEMIAFPLGTFKDQVDATSGAYNKLAEEGGLYFA